MKEYIELYSTIQDYTNGNKALQKTLNNFQKHLGTSTVLSAMQIKEQINSSTSTYREDYASKIKEKSTNKPYPYLLPNRAKSLKNDTISFTVCNENSPNEIEQNKQIKSENIENQKVIYAHNWRILPNILSKKENNLLLIHLHDFPPLTLNPNLKISYKKAFEAANYIFVPNDRLKEYVMINFDIQPYKIIIIHNEYKKIIPPINTSKYRTQKNHKVIILGDYLKYNTKLYSLLKYLVKQNYIPILFGKGIRLKNIIKYYSHSKTNIDFFDHLDFKTWELLHEDGHVYYLDINKFETNLQIMKQQLDMERLFPLDFNDINFKIMDYDIDYYIHIILKEKH